MASELGFNGQLTASLEVADLDRAIAWYRDVLGFEVDYRMDEMGWAEVKSSVARVNVGLSRVDEPKTDGGATLTFGVADMDAARAALDGSDVKFDGDVVELPGMVKLLGFFDPDGNRLMLFQVLGNFG